METLERLRKKASELPLKPGVYIMLDASHEVIYVGKAKKLKNRVSSYFHGSHNAKTEAMVSKVEDFNIIIANSEFEALVLENSLIKRHMPKYNILLKDDKGYPFIRLDIKSLYPKFSVVPRADNDGAMYFGPYGGRGASFSAIDAISRALKLPTCGKNFPQDVGKGRPCLNYHLDLCSGYCLKDTSPDEYRQAINEAILVLQGKTNILVDKLRGEMEDAAENLQFEKAARLRDRIRALDVLSTKQLAWSFAMVDTDAVGYYRSDVKACFVVLHYVEGQLLGKDMDMLDIPAESDDEALEGLIRQFYTSGVNIPKNICIPMEIPDRENMELFISDIAGKKINLYVPQRGDKRKLVETANLNAVEETERATTKAERISKTALWLKNSLDLPDVPKRIEAFDVSNTGNTDIVASMTVFENGKPLKRDYRRFKMKSVATQDDYASMTEAVSRRFQRYLDGDEKFSPLPDLLLIDGGHQHTAIIKDLLDSMSLTVPVFGMVKDDRHRTRALVTPYGAEIGIDSQPHVFSFIGTIQEETHRFAIEYNHKLHNKSGTASTLDKIPGVGTKRKSDLLKQFKSITAIKNAKLDELEKVVPRNTAKSVFDYFHGDSGGKEN